jgi:hypothetical protein
MPGVTFTVRKTSASEGSPRALSQNDEDSGAICVIGAPCCEWIAISVTGSLQGCQPCCNSFSIRCIEPPCGTENGNYAIEG